METGFLDRLANQLKANKSAACRRAIQRILVRIKEHCESGQYQNERIRDFMCSGLSHPTRIIRKS
jgi:hypothetical protein